MDIHVSDIIIKSDLPVADNLVRILIQDHWPHMIYEIDERTDGVDMFVYKNEEAKRKWDADGWKEENDTTMITVLFSVDLKEVSFTIDDNEINKYIVDDICQFIKGCNNVRTS